MEYLFIYFIIFVLTFILYRLYFSLRTKYQENKKIIEVYYLETKYKLKFKESEKPKLYNLIAFINSFILVVSYAIFNISTNIILQVIVTIITVFVLIYSFYSILGTYYKKQR